MRFIKATFLMMLAAVFLYLAAGQIFLSGEKNESIGDCELFQADWYRICSDGSRERLELPVHYPAKRGEKVVIEAVIPKLAQENSTLCLRSSQQDMKIYVDDVLRQEYTDETIRLWGKNSKSGFVFLDLKQQDEGKTIRVETVSDSAYSGLFNVVYIGDRMGIWQYFMRQYGFTAGVAVFLLLLGIISILFSIVLRICYKKKFVLEYLSWGIVLAAFWMISESRLRQLFFANTTAIADIAFFCIMLLPFPFLIYVNSIQHGRYEKFYILAGLEAFVDFVICVFLQLTGMADFLDTLIFMYITIGIAIVLCAITIGIDMRKGYIREYMLVAAGLYGLMVAGVVELAMIYHRTIQYNGVILGLGLIFLLVTVVLKTGKDIMDTEKERHKAILISESKTSFLANMSHEIRTPINTIIGMNEMILRENHDTGIQKYAINIKEASKMLVALINDVLDFSKIESGKLQLQESAYHPASIFNDVIHILKDRAEKKKLQVCLNIDANIPSVLNGDEVRIKQILTNLLTNAVKYTKEGTITFRAEGCWNHESEFILKLSVADTGDGIKPENFDKIFQRFTRLDEKKNKSIQGTGLGLTITKQLLELMGGEISVQSVYQEGSLFTVKIPQKVLDAEGIGDLEKAYDRECQELYNYRERFRAPGASVLAVDDNEMNLIVISGLLKNTEVQLDTVTSGEEGLKLCRKKKYHLILMDHMMPEMDGIETLHRLKSEEDNPNVDTKVIALTANAIAGSREMYLKEGFSEYISKPVEAERLEMVMQKYLPEELVLPTVQNGEMVQEMVEGMTQEKELDTVHTPELIDRQLGMTYCGGDEEFYQKILKTYYEQGQSYFDKLPVYYQEKDWKNYAIVVHAIKSTSLTIGAREFSELAKNQELAAKAGDGAAVEEQWEYFYQKYEEILRAVREMTCQKTEDKGNETGGQNNFSQFVEECRELLECIQGYEMNEALRHLDRLSEMENTGLSGYAGTAVSLQLSKIRDCVENFEYENAENMLAEWLEQRED